MLGLVVLASWPAAQRSRAVIAAVLLASFLVKPNGILALPLGSSPVIAGIWLALAVLAWYTWGRRDSRPRTADHREALSATRSVLAEP